MKLKVVLFSTIITVLMPYAVRAQSAPVPWTEVELLAHTQGNPIFPVKRGNLLFFTSATGKQTAFGTNLSKYDATTKKEEVVLTGKIFGIQRLGTEIYVDHEKDNQRRFEKLNLEKNRTEHVFPDYPRQYARLQYQIDQDSRELGFKSSGLAKRKWLIREGKLQILFSVNAMPKKMVVGDLPFDTKQLPTYALIDLQGNEAKNADGEWIEGWVVREGELKIENGKTAYRQHYLVRGFGETRQFLIIDQKADPAAAKDVNFPRFKRWTNSVQVISNEALKKPFTTAKFPELKVNYPAFLVGLTQGALIADRTEVDEAFESLIFLSDRNDEGVRQSLSMRDFGGASESDGGYVVARPLAKSIVWWGEKLADAEQWQNPASAHAIAKDSLEAKCPGTPFAVHAIEGGESTTRALTYRQGSEASIILTTPQIKAIACDKNTLAVLVDSGRIRLTSGHGRLDLRKGTYGSNVDTDGNIAADANRGPVILYFEDNRLSLVRQSPEKMVFSQLARHPTEPLYAAWLDEGGKPFTDYLNVFPTAQGFDGYEYISFTAATKPAENAGAK